MPSAYTRRIIIVIQAAHLDNANNRARQVDTTGGNAFQVGLSPTGVWNQPPTHYWCSWVCTEVEWNALTSRFGDDTVAKPGRTWDGNLVSASQVLAETGLKTIDSDTN